MRIKSTVVCSLLVIFTLLAFVPAEVHARKRLLPGRSEGMATIKVMASSIDQVARAVMTVFSGDGYILRQEREGQLIFSRPAGRAKDFSYGGLAGGMYEQVIINIRNIGGDNYSIECNVYMTEGDHPPDTMDTEILKLFGREYQRMLRRVKRKLN